VPAILQTTNGNVSINNTVQGGSIKALLDMGGVSTTQTTVRGVLGQLNTLITELANSVNALQLSGRDATGNIPTEPIFELAAGTSLAIFRYSANVDLIQNPNLVAAAINDPTASGPPAGFAGVGDGRNALRIAQLRNQSIAALAGGTFGDSFNSTVSRLGIDTRSYEDRQASQKDVINTLGQRRDAISGVNMDEEMIDMMRFQRAFEASSRMIRTFDEVAQAIINLVS
jgi:flagellar hook-associated protein 1 FlgK